ncbi:MAG TPA: class I SAM-dependent methyltransferase [Tenuifilaceae bacterium]|nr:class I SAM-dependent methyltransferase [Tenuifilaceae bacterium]HPI45660.1 class I SAM-dependent methyltransferase [Tenuifilaceae bacterium]HPN20425.1 class I SAM-dependent methyltransferase [Tenuifilaceae bacterium]
MLQLQPNWPDYELIDSGNFEKLERFGNQVVARPEPQAIWDKALPQKEWQKLANSTFIYKQGNYVAEAERGDWESKPNALKQWYVEYNYKEMKLKFRLGLTAFKHVGIFPEQASNWNFIYDRVKSFNLQKPTVLNLFAYTGGASLAACAAGADVTHVDSVKPTVTWANENMNLSGLSNIRWVIEDALKYANREAKRGKTYNGIILDPPAYGRGPSGEKWILEKSVNELLKVCYEISDKNNFFIVLNLYSMGFSSNVAKSLLYTIFKKENIESGELVVPDNYGRIMPNGVFARF